MGSNRPYRQALSLPEIMTEVRENLGTQFDPQVAQAALDIMAREKLAWMAPQTKAQPVKEPELMVEVMPLR